MTNPRSEGQQFLHAAARGGGTIRKLSASASGPHQAQVGGVLPWDGAASKPLLGGDGLVPEALSGDADSPGLRAQSDLSEERAAQFQQKVDRWIKVTKRQRLSRFARKDKPEGRTVHIFGALNSISSARFVKIAHANGIPALGHFSKFSWEGSGSSNSRRLSIQFETSDVREGLYPRLRAMAQKMGWSAKLGRVHALRVAQREGNSVAAPAVTVEAGQRKLDRKGNLVVATENPFATLALLDSPASSLSSDEILASTRSVNFGSFNAQTLTETTLLSLAQCCASDGVEIVAVQETKWAKSSEHEARGFKFCGEPAVGDSGGVGFLIALSILGSVQFLGAQAHRNQYWIKVQLSTGEYLLVCSAYMPQSSDTSEAKKAFEILRSSILAYGKEGRVLVLGDMNAHVGRGTVGFGKFGEKCSSCSNGLRLASLLRDPKVDLVAANCRKEVSPLSSDIEYTRLDRTGLQAVLDYILVPKSALSENCVACVNYTDLNSDHHLVTFVYSGAEVTKRPSVKKPASWATSQLRGVGERPAQAREKYSCAVSKSLLGFGDWLKTSKPMSADVACAEWKKRVEVAASAVSRKTRGSRKFNHDWFDKEVKAALRVKQLAFRTARSSGNVEDARKFVELREQYSKLVKTKKKASWNRLVSKLESEFRSHERLFYSTLGRMAGIKAGTDAIGPVADSNGVLQFEESAKREAMANFYEKLGTPVLASKQLLAQIGDLSITTRYDDSFLQRVSQSVRARLSLSLGVTNDKRLDGLVKVNEVASVLLDLRLGAPGGDRIPAEFLRFGGQGMAEGLCALFNWILDHSSIPSSWGKALVVLLFKDGARSDPGNYRGISLLDIVGKVFSKVVARRLDSALDIVSSQAGFTRGRGCQYDLFALVQILHKRKRMGQNTYLFFLDVRKAFDTVWRDGLMFKLWKQGVRGKLWRALYAMYSNNKTSILINGQPTRWFDILQGVRQGATESPTLFKFYINGLAQSLRKSGLGVALGGVLEDNIADMLSILLFADDVVLFANSREELQKMIDVVALYSHKWRFEENLGKCGVMSVLAASSKPSKPASLEFLGRAVKEVHQYKYLGVIVHESLLWEQHIKRIADKALAARTRYQRILTNRRLSVRLRLHVYKTYIMPLFDYASDIWWADTKQATKLEAIQMSVLRDILQCNAKTNNVAVRSVLGVIPLEMRRARFMVNWYARLLVEPRGSLMWRLPSLVPSVWRGRKGRGMQARCWFDIVQEAADRLSPEKDLLKLLRRKYIVWKTQDTKADSKANAIPEDDLPEGWIPIEGEIATIPRKSVRRLKKSCQRMIKDCSLKACATSFVGEAAVHPRLRFLSRVIGKIRPTLLRGLQGPLKGAKLIQLRLLMGTSAVQSDLSKWNNGDSLCPCCGQEEESVEHFLLRCSHFDASRREWYQAMSESSWGLMHWSQTFLMEDDVGKCALLLGHPRPVQKGPEEPFPDQLALVFIRVLYEERSRKLDDLSSKEESDRSAAAKDAKRRKQARTRSQNAAAARATQHAKSKEEADDGSRVTIRTFFSVLPKKGVAVSAVNNSSEEYESIGGVGGGGGGGGCGGGRDQSSLRAGSLGRKPGRRA
jgi:hypothetical protein